MTQPAELDVLQEFAQKSPSERQWIPAFDIILEQIAETCETNHPWSLLREVLKAKINLNVKMDPVAAAEGATLPDTGETIDEYLQRISTAMNIFDRPPFTLQRLCELATRPTEHHKTVWKYLRAVEKVLLVTSYDDPPHMHPPSEHPGEPREEIGEGGGWARDGGVDANGVVEMSVDVVGMNGEVDGVATKMPLIPPVEVGWGGVNGIGEGVAGVEGVEGEGQGKGVEDATPMETD
ncbi:Serine/threonine-protein phosphatase 4 regulatory subunit 2 [Rhizophlyctis rosea]|nr:Serine/threonine-protein phosphatase 4 regulatory subunit 2 [Rhizophlyctis rosea]